MKYQLTFLVVSLSSLIYAQDRQPFYFQTRVLVETLDFLGAPLTTGDKTTILQSIAEDAPGRIEAILDKYALFNVEINPESRVKARAGLAKPELLQGGWRTFLVKVSNQAGITAKLDVASEQAKRPYDGGDRLYGMGHGGHAAKITAHEIRDRWMDLSLYVQSPMQGTLSGLALDYFIIQLYSRDAGKRAANFSFNCGQGTQDLGFRSEANMLFNCLPSHKIRLEILDENKIPTTASFVIKDKQGHVYPSQMKRLAPDFFFQQQVYRSHHETIELPAGVYSIEYGRGPEYFKKLKTLTVSNDTGQQFSVQLERWIDPARFGWYSGDHHIHAAGCSHYTSPTEGVDPKDMMRHIVGEGVNVGCVLTWGPGYYHQKQFFEGKDHNLSTKNHLMRYDLEISGFPSSHAGHLVLLRLKDQDYPNTKVLEDWPTYTIPVLKWAKAQNAITGYAHSGLGLEVKTDSLPNFAMPRFDGIGANEFIVAVTQNLVDFISTEDTPPVWELNIWYHTLNCGFRTRISGETDFPCISDDKVAHGRSYVKIKGDLNFDEWTEGLRAGRCYVSEGKSHIMDFKINNTEVGTANSEVKLSASEAVKITAKVSAYLDEVKSEGVRALNLQQNIWDQKPFWNIERGRIGNTRKVPVELVVNGRVAGRKEIVADGTVQEISFDARIKNSSWVALRILPSSHTNPLFVLVDGKPIRADRKSAEWCLRAVDVCWHQKEGRISGKERAQAEKDYAEAKRIYQQILNESGTN